MVMRDGGLPQDQDQYLLNLKNELSKQYPISKSKMFLVGEGSRADYAAYFGVTYPEAFKGVALLDGGWGGVYNSMIRYKKTDKDQVPFYVALKNADAARAQAIENSAYTAEKYGYPIIVSKLKANQKFSSML